ncbi:uncharacterized protein LOC110812062 isoform X1 [Carica papaya]|uniref:uncharacterized protein LOC110812062 isoform X1 n=1 Tax=Carica papaya TaxID=3649 RepID=UPI000B8CBEFB|nr:uncharacterized protein LOC110812062 isoform X1 [Carica papaya]
MAKREISSTLRNLKFMQRAAKNEEKAKKEEEVKPEGNFFPPGIVNRRCVVIMEGDPHPGAVIGRMSFQSFNPSIDKLNEDATNIRPPDTSATCSSNQGGRVSFRESGSSPNVAECSKLEQDSEPNGDHKRRQSDIVSEPQYPNKLPKNIEANQHSSRNNSKDSCKQPKHTKLNWRALRPPRPKNKKDELH